MVEIPSTPTNETPPLDAIYPVFVPGAQPGDPGRVISLALADYAALMRTGSAQLVATAFDYDDASGILTITLTDGAGVATQELRLGSLFGNSALRSISRPSANTLRFRMADDSTQVIVFPSFPVQTAASFGCETAPSARCVCE
ncbi:MAG: hypothetical protein F4X35_00090, partial [Alphaproteobacteria bacterium]|nr:hypothetical protein [Alphaproteobacteria bacterium]